MCALLLTLMVGGPVPTAEPPPRAAVEQRDRGYELPAAPVLVLTEGSSGRQGKAADAVVAELKALLGARHQFSVARFDAEPTLQPGMAMTGEHRDLVLVRPRTPMRDVMEMALRRLATVPGPHRMIVVAHEEFYSTTVSEGRLLDLALRSETTVHTVHLAAVPKQAGLFRRIGRSLRNGVLRLVEVLAVEERAYSPKDTARLLKVIADATGGKACVARDEPSGSACADAIAAEIVRHSR